MTCPPAWTALHSRDEIGVLPRAVRPRGSRAPRGWCSTAPRATAPPRPILALVDEHDRRYGRGFVIGHRDVSRKSCPGPVVYERVVVPLGRPLA